MITRLQILVFITTEFILGIEYSRIIMIPFYVEWAHLNQFQIQTLQSWYMLWIFLLEVPTGILGDKLGLKFSILIGFMLKLLGVSLYVITPQFTLFLIAEFVLASGIAFISGAKEAWFYELVIHSPYRKDYSKINAFRQNAYLIGMILSSLTTSLVARYLSIRLLSATSLISTFLAILLYLTIPKSPTEIKIQLSPKYISIIKRALKFLKKNRKFLNTSIFISIIATFGYFTKWLYQTILIQYRTPIEKFGLYRLIFLLAQSGALLIFGNLSTKMQEYSKRLLLSLSVVLGYICATLMHGGLGVSMLLILAGGVGLQIRTIYSKELNESLPPSQRATLLSFIGMLEKLILFIMNPLVGLFTDLYEVEIVLKMFSIAGLFLVLYLSYKMLYVLRIKKV